MRSHEFVERHDPRVWWVEDNYRGIGGKLQLFVDTLREIRHSQCGVAYVNADLSLALWLTLALRLAGVAAVVVHSQNSRFDSPKYAWRIWVYQRLIRLLAARLAANARECAIGTFGRSDDVSFVPSIIDFESLGRDAAAIPRNRNNSDFTLACIGRLAEQKNMAFAIRLIARLPDTSLRTKLLIAGDGPLRGDLMTLARDLGVEDRVEFVGPVVKIAEFLVQEVDAVLIPSLFEGQVRVLGEAQCVGLPVLASAGVPKTAWILDDPLSRAGLPLVESLWVEEILCLVGGTKGERQLNVRHAVNSPHGLREGAGRISRLIQEAAENVRRRQDSEFTTDEASEWPDLGPKSPEQVRHQKAQ
jgi:glycosyltransferase involved in cell wall biosynthesis